MKSALRKLARSFLYTQNTVRYRVEFARLAEAFRLIGRQGSVLDGGAGSGEMLRKAHAAGFCLEGHALEPEHFAILQQNYRNISGLRCTQGGLLGIPFAAESFDCAMSTQVLEHIEDHEKAAAELARVVKPGGYLIISVPHPPEPFPNPDHVREGYLEKDLKTLFPAPAFEHLHTSYFLTRPTLERIMAFDRLPFRGVFMPAVLADCESTRTAAERQAEQPYGIMTVFRKAA